MHLLMQMLYFCFVRHNGFDFSFFGTDPCFLSSTIHCVFLKPFLKVGTLSTKFIVRIRHEVQLGRDQPQELKGAHLLGDNSGTFGARRLKLMLRPLQFVIHLLQLCLHLRNCNFVLCFTIFVRLHLLS